MANCNICNKEIEEGYICIDCANQQRAQNRPATAAPGPATPSNQGGFSLNGLLSGQGTQSPVPPANPSGPTNPHPTAQPTVKPPVNSPPTSPLPSVNNPTQPLTPPPAATPAPSPAPSFSTHPTQAAFTPPSPTPSSTIPSGHTMPAPQAPATSAQSATPAFSNPNQPPKPALQPSVNQPAQTLNSPMPGAPAPAQARPQPVMPSATPSAHKTAVPNQPQTTASAQVVPATPASSTSDQDEASKTGVYDSDVTGYGDEDLEISILAGIMKDNFILENLKGKGLIAGLFSTRYSRGLYRSIQALREESPDLSSLDKIVLKNKLKQLNLWDSTVQGFLEKVVKEPSPMLDQCLHYLELMKEQALKRKLKEVAHGIHEFIDTPPQNENENLESFTNKVIQDVRNIQKARTTKRINLVREEMKEITADMNNREITGEVEIIGYSFEPMHYLNIAVSGFRKGFMYAIAGAPRRGKTTFTLELATRVASINKIPVLFFTYEQTKKNLTYRLLAKESRLNPDSLQRKKIRSDMVADAKFMSGWKRMQEYMDYFYIIEATKEDTVDRIRSYAYNVMQDFNTENIMIFVDYIQKMPLSRNYNDEKFKVEEISTELKGLSIELNNPIMTISSLSKEGCMIDATPDGERPTMYHCKGSGDLEYDLDCAMIQAKDWGDTRELYQQLQHKADELGKDSTRVPKVDVVNLYLDKNRDAPEGIFSTIQYLFFIEDNKFIELGPKYEDDRFRFSKIEELVESLIQANYIIFYDKPKDASYNKGRVSIKLKNF